MVRLAPKHRTVQPGRRKSARSGVYQFRPFCPVGLIPVCAWLCESEYSYQARHDIIDRLKQGISPLNLVGAGLVDREDLDQVEHHLAAGRAAAARVERSRVASASTSAGEWTRLDRAETRREKLRMKRDYPMRLRVLDAPAPTEDNEGNEGESPARPDFVPFVPSCLDGPDPTADANGDPVHYEHGRPAPMPVVEREPFGPGLDADGPTDAEWEEMYEASRRERPEFTPSGWLD